MMQRFSALYLVASIFQMSCLIAQTGYKENTFEKGIGKNHRIAIVASRFNGLPEQLLLEGAMARFAERGIEILDEDVFSVPGSVEIPVVAACLAQSQKYDAILCLGVIIRGATDHYDYVCNHVTHGCQKVAVEYRIPVVFGVLTTNNEQQALDRCGGTHGHMGIYSADVAIEMAGLISGLSKGEEYGQ